MADRNVQCVWVTIKRPHKPKRTIGNFYREWCGNNSAVQSQNLDIFLNQVSCYSKGQELSLIGDFNLDSKKWNNPCYQWKPLSDKLISNVQCLGLKHLSAGDTFRQTRDGVTITSALDHIFSSEIQAITTCKTITTGKSDHELIMCTMTLQKQEEKQKVIRYRRKIVDYNAFKRDMANQPWECLADTENVDDQLDLFYTMYNEVLNKYSPWMTRKQRKNTRCPLSKETKTAMKTRDRLKKELYGLTGIARDIKLKQFKKERNRVISMIRADEKANVEKLINSDVYKNPWRAVNSLFKNKKDNSIPLKKGEENLSDNKTKANVLNSVFKNKIQKIKEHTDAKPFESCEKIRCRSTFTLKTIGEFAVKKCIRSLKNTKACGKDEIQTEHLKLISDVIAIPLQFMINTSITQGVFPKQLKSAIITPIHKKGSKSSPENYRPVASVSVLSKVYETVIQEQIRSYFESQNLFPKSQHGFREKRSTTTTSLINLTNELNTTKNMGKWSAVTFLDLSSAFDCIDHGILLKKLELYGFDSVALSWIKSFITNRTQVVRIGDQYSDPEILKWGVPQGCVISPLLFIIYIADIEQWSEKCKLNGFADDYNITVTGDNAKDIIAMAQHEFESIEKFYDVERTAS